MGNGHGLQQYAIASVVVDVDRSVACKFTIAGFTTMHSHAGVVAYGLIRHECRAGVDDHKSKGAVVAGDAIIAADIGFGAVGDLDSRSAIVADYILRSRSNAIATVKDQMAGEDGN